MGRAWEKLKTDINTRFIHDILKDKINLKIQEKYLSGEDITKHHICGGK